MAVALHNSLGDLFIDKGERPSLIVSLSYDRSKNEQNQLQSPVQLASEQSASANFAEVNNSSCAKKQLPTPPPDLTKAPNMVRKSPDESPISSLPSASPACQNGAGPSSRASEEPFLQASTSRSGYKKIMFNDIVPPRERSPQTTSPTLADNNITSIFHPETSNFYSYPSTPIIERPHLTLDTLMAPKTRRMAASAPPSPKGKGKNQVVRVASAKYMPGNSPGIRAGAPRITKQLPRSRPSSSRKSSRLQVREPDPRDELLTGLLDKLLADFGGDNDAALRYLEEAQGVDFLGDEWATELDNILGQELQAKIEYEKVQYMYKLHSCNKQYQAEADALSLKVPAVTQELTDGALYLKYGVQNDLLKDPIKLNEPITTAYNNEMLKTEGKKQMHKRKCDNSSGITELDGIGYITRGKIHPTPVPAATEGIYERTQNSHNPIVKKLYEREGFVFDKVRHPQEKTKKTYSVLGKRLNGRKKTGPSLDEAVPLGGKDKTMIELVWDRLVEEDKRNEGADSEKKSIGAKTSEKTSTEEKENLSQEKAAGKIAITVIPPTPQKRIPTIPLTPTTESINNVNDATQPQRQASPYILRNSASPPSPSPSYSSSREATHATLVMNNQKNKRKRVSEEKEGEDSSKEQQPAFKRVEIEAALGSVEPIGGSNGDVAGSAEIEAADSGFQTSPTQQEEAVLARSPTPDQVQYTDQPNTDFYTSLSQENNDDFERERLQSPATNPLDSRLDQSNPDLKATLDPEPTRRSARGRVPRRPRHEQEVYYTK